MSDTASPFGTIANGQIDQVSLANALFNSLSVAALYGLDEFNSAGLVVALFGGKVSIAGTITTIAAQNVTVTASATNYIQANPSTGTISSNTSGYSVGFWQIGRAVAGTATMTWYDDRFSGGFAFYPLLVKTLPSDANYSLTASEARASILNISGTISAARNIYVPLISQQWTVFNNTTGGFGLQFIGASGTGITVAATKRAIIYADGTNIVRVTADT